MGGLPFLVVASLVSRGGAAVARCDGPATSRALAIVELAPPPLADDPTKDATARPAAYVTSDLEAAWRSRASAPIYVLQKANRGPRPADAAGADRRPPPSVFASIAQADACTLAQAGALLGADTAPGRKHGARARPASAGDDACPLPRRPLPPHVAGLVLDFEPFDDRSGAEAEALLVAYAALAHGAETKVILYSLPWNGLLQRRNGLDEKNLPRLVALYDRTIVLLRHRSREGDLVASFENQREVLGARRADRIMIAFDLRGATVPDAKTTASLIRANGLREVIFWPNVEGADESCDGPLGRKVACFAPGRCRE